MGRRSYGWRDAVMIQLWDGRQVPGRWISGLPAFRYGWAPDGLATRRQVRAKRLCPGGHEPYALLVWRRDRAFAWLYRLDLAQPSRIPTAAQQAALTRAMAARRWCAGCQQHADHCVARSTGLCGDCMAKQTGLAA
ncbi:RRQRL motif-containing zinc-binding protein [Actinopolymorpha sp. B9G3]|uniref:RRQRL motif-containing zinc-binding protein n=1 Tax=Actinopolymorpha sp. B9G3 TaxID=3158970 RepID=UPI0032D8E36E